jgi:hypothetical protein
MSSDIFLLLIFFFSQRLLPILLISLLLFYFFKKYEVFKSFFIHLKKKFMNLTISRSHKYQFDLPKFVILSIVITFFIHIVLSKLSGQSVILSITNIIPGKEIFETYLKPSYNITIPTISGNVTIASYTFESIQPVIRFIAPIGAIAFFVLRQLHYRASKYENKYPGANIFLIFIIAVPIVLLLDQFTISGAISVLDPSLPKVSSLYDTKKFKGFIDSYLLDPFFYIGTMAIWIADRYIFSKYWIKENYSIG